MLSSLRSLQISVTFLFLSSVDLTIHISNVTMFFLSLFQKRKRCNEGVREKETTLDQFWKKIMRALKKMFPCISRNDMFFWGKLAHSIRALGGKTRVFFKWRP